MVDKKATRVALSQIASLEQELDQTPARNATEVSKGHAIAILAPKLHALRAKGYAWRDIAAWLTEHGVSVSTPALQRYLRTAKPSLKREKGGGGSRLGSALEQRSSTAHASTSPSTRAHGTQTTGSVPPPVRTPTDANTRGQQPTPDGFVVRPDRREI